MKRVVLDTNVLTAGLRSRAGASYAILRMVGGGAILPLCSTALFLEYEAVLRRPEQMEVHGLSQMAIDLFLAGFASVAEEVEVHMSWRPQLPDPDDEMILDAAVNGRAGALVSHNVRDFELGASRFGIQVITPRQLLRELRS